MGPGWLGWVCDVDGGDGTDGRGGDMSEFHFNADGYITRFQELLCYHSTANPKCGNLDRICVSDVLEIKTIVWFSHGFC